MTVNRENVRKWVDALRSGEYQQGYTALKDEKIDGTIGYCCLGVACDISGVGEWEDSDEEASFYFAPSDDDTLDGSSILLPKAVMEWLGVALDSPYVTVYDRQPTDPDVFDFTRPRPRENLTALNDSEHYTFAQIADLIEHEWLGEEE